MATNTCELLRLGVERGPNWLFLRIHPSKSGNYSTMVDQLWSILACHFTYRVVIELEEFKSLPSQLVDQLSELRERVLEHGGWLRLCGLSERAQADLASYRTDEELRNHSCREHAVKGRDAAHGSVSSPHFDFATTAVASE